ncbi:MAG: hypothetical protein HGA82_03420 [Anaerolineales bacterium]|nr:hypothetical protein [Anaerolineales bacterium]
MLTELDPDSGGGEFFKIGDIQPAPERIILDTDPLSRAYESGCQVLPIQSIRYFVDNTDSTHPNLMMQVLGEDPVVYAEYVDDLQFQYRLRNGTVVDAPSVPSETREVLLTVVARTAIADSDFPDNPYRHATYASKVNLRNLSTW